MWRTLAGVSLLTALVFATGHARQERGDEHQIRRVVEEAYVSGGWRSQSGLWLHFGLGNAHAIDELLVRWPSGAEQRLRDIPVNQGITVTEGQAWRPGLAR